MGFEDRGFCRPQDVLFDYGTVRLELSMIFRLAHSTALLACYAIACTDQGALSQATDRAPDPPRQSVQYRLVEDLRFAQVNTAASFVSFNDLSGRHLFSSGWNPAGAEARGTGVIWTRKRNAAVDVPLTSPEDLTISLTLSPPPREALMPRQQISILWNGHRVHRQTLPWEPIRVTFGVPAHLSRHGLNRMLIQPSYWIVPDTLTGNGDVRSIGVGCSGFAVTPSASRRRDRSRDEVAIATGTTIRQQPGSVISYYYLLPPGARLRARVSVRPVRSASGSMDGRLTVALTDQEGGEHLLVEEPMDGRQQVLELDHDLSPWSREMVALNLSLETSPDGFATAGSDVPWVEWRNPRITGSAVEREGSGREGPDRYNVFVFVLDALRADRLSSYGDDTTEDPALRNLAESGVTFTRAYSNSSWTRPSVASYMTSLYPPVHGILGIQNSLRDDVPYLPEILQGSGYKTVAVINNGQISSEFGFDRGFDEFHEIFATASDAGEAEDPAIQASRIWERNVAPALQALDDQPYFLYWHEIDPHAPYDPPEPYSSMYQPELTANYDNSLSIKKLINRQVMKLDEYDVQYLNAQYRGEISYMDRYLERVLDEMEREGLMENTLVLFISDHGEEFMEHGGIRHGRTLHEELVHVPMMWALDGILPRDRRVDAVVELIDVPPTILDLAGIAVPESMQGGSIVPLMLGDDDDPLKPSYAQVGEDGSDAVTLGRWRLLRRKRGGRVEYALFDHSKDPGEQVDRWTGEPVVGAALRQMLMARMSQNAGLREGENSQIEKSEMRPETLQNLRALGYIQ